MLDLLRVSFKEHIVFREGCFAENLVHFLVSRQTQTDPPCNEHKRAAYWFYRFLSIVYDTYVNPLFWTERMRGQALALGRLHDSTLHVIDVGSGTGLTTQGIVKSVNAGQVACVDQSPHQQKKAKAKAKPELKVCTFSLGDAEHIPL